MKKETKLIIAIAILVIIIIGLLTYIIYDIMKEDNSNIEMSSSQQTNSESAQYKNLIVNVLHKYSNLYYQGEYIDMIDKETSHRRCYTVDGQLEIPLAYIGHNAICVNTIEETVLTDKQWNPLDYYEENKVDLYMNYPKEEVDKYWGITQGRKLIINETDNRPIEEIYNGIKDSWVPGTITPQYTNYEEFVQMALHIEELYLTPERYNELSQMIKDNPFKDKQVNDESDSDNQQTNSEITGIQQAIKDGQMGDDCFENGISEEWLYFTWSDGNLQFYYDTWEECLQDAKDLGILREATEEELNAINSGI